MKPLLREAFLAVPGEPSQDAVIADPQLNVLFIQECRLRGLSESIELLNRTLLNARKAKDLQGIRKSKRRVVRNQDDFRFASEIAVRFLERRDQVSLDQIICSPDRAAEFDQLAGQISPGFSSFEYRWAALNLRKRNKLKPEILSRVARSSSVSRYKVADLKLESVPTLQGLYILFDSQETLYVGECQNLRKRIRKHLDHSDNKGLASWLWQHGPSELYLELHILPDDTETRARKALETELIRSRHPAFNVCGSMGS